MKINLNSILIGVTDITKSVPFYEKVFGVKFSEIRPPFSCFTMEGVEFNIEENSSERSEGWKDKNIGTTKPISFETDDINAFLEIVESASGKIVTAPLDRPWGWCEAEFADVDGNTFIVEQEL